MRETAVRLASVSVVSMLLFVGSQAIAQPIEATTATGDKVLLIPTAAASRPGTRTTIVARSIPAGAEDEWKKFVEEKYECPPEIVYVDSPVMVDNAAGKITVD